VEEVFVAVIREDEAESLVRDEPLDGSVHDDLPTVERELTRVAAGRKEIRKKSVRPRITCQRWTI
jgi:hypothetical protein